MTESLYQEFDGKRYNIGSNGYYYKTLGATDKINKGKARESMHRAVWIYHNGEIPHGHVVHHKDENRANNEINNLDLMLSSEHRAMHAKEFHQNNPEHSRLVIEKNQDKCREWHASEAGYEWHKQNYEQMKHLMHVKANFVCEICNKEYEAEKKGGTGNKYCSMNCKAQGRRLSGVDNEDRTCPVCDTVFSINKYYKTQCCSKKCAGFARRKI